MPVYAGGRERTSSPRPGRARRRSERPMNFSDKEEVPFSSSGSRALESSATRTMRTTADSRPVIRSFGVGRVLRGGSHGCGASRPLWRGRPRH